MTQTLSGVGSPPPDVIGDEVPNPKGKRAERHPRRMRVKCPTVIQMEAVECGAASLAMVLGYFGRFVPLEELRAVSGVSRDGAKAGNLLKAARRYGLAAKGMQMEIDALSALRPPAILFWNFNHFVVFEGFGRRLGHRVAYLNDPASGRRKVPLTELDESFTGVVLTMERGAEFQRGGRPPNLLADLRGRYQRSGSALTLAVLATLLLVIPGIATPAFTRAFIDRILSSGDSTLLLPLLAAIAATATLTVLLTIIQQGYLLRVESATAVRSSTRIVRHLLRLPVAFFTQRNPADVAKRVSSNDDVAQVLARDVATTMVNVLLVVGYAFLLWTYDVELTIVGVGMALLNVAVLDWVSRMRRDSVAKLRADRARLVSTSYNGLQLIETMKATGAENDYFGRWSGFQAKVVSGQQRLGVPAALLSIAPTLLAALNSSLLLLIGGLRAIEGHISIGLLVAFQALVAQFSRPVAQLTNLGPKIQDLAADIARLKDIEQFPIAAVFERDDPPVERRLDGGLVFEDVTFGYSPLAEPLLNSFSFKVGPGQRIALVGGSGSGKSTVSRLIAGLYDPWRGSIRFDGRDRAEIPRSLLAASVAFVDQEIFLFEGTVRENVTLWDPSIPDEDVVAALKDAMVYDVVSARPGSISSLVSEGGRNFSGGQRQRLEIARALVRSPSVLVLDEATSALDSETEKRIDDNLRQRGCACVIIAHRLSTIRDSDEILVLEHGALVQRGTHETLMATEGPYLNLLREQ
jgi:NHLM bacteriocin system ABC transporter peptidase/ATP-binding protein